MARQTVTKDRAYYEMRYARSRTDLLFVIIFSLINCILAFFGTGYMFLFAAIFPMILSALSGILLLHPDMLTELLELDPLSSAEVLSVSGSVIKVFGILLLAVTVLILLVYFFAWLGSKKKGGWLVAALVFFSIDCVFMIFSISDVRDIIDILFHVWVMYDLICGVIAWNKLKKMPETVVEGSFAEAVPSPVTAEPGEISAEPTALSADTAEPEEPLSPLAAAAAAASVESPEEADEEEKEDEDEDEEDDEGDF